MRQHKEDSSLSNPVLCPHHAGSSQGPRDQWWEALFPLRLFDYSPTRKTEHLLSEPWPIRVNWKDKHEPSSKTANCVASNENCHMDAINWACLGNVPKPQSKRETKTKAWLQQKLGWATETITKKQWTPFSQWCRRQTPRVDTVALKVDTPGWLEGITGARTAWMIFFIKWGNSSSYLAKSLWE